MSRGHDRERDVADLLYEWGWLCVRSTGSLGPVDVVAIGDGLLRYPGQPSLVTTTRSVLLIEVKSTEKSPFEHFGPADRAELIRMAKRCGARPVLAYWPKTRPGARKIDALRWIWEDAWPA